MITSLILGAIVGFYGRREALAWLHETRWLVLGMVETLGRGGER